MAREINGKGKVIVAKSGFPTADNPAGRKQHGVDEVFQPRISTDALRRLDHADWLENFAKVMQLQTGVEMTPMRAGVVSRCRFAAEYIRLIKVEHTNAMNHIVQQKRLIDRQREQIAKLRAAADDADEGEGDEGR
jgi:hypothetical protein